MSTLGAKRRFALGLCSGIALLLPCRSSAAEPKPSKHSVVIDGISVPPHGDDLLGLARLKFQGLISSELASAGYRVAVRETAEPSALTLVGLLKEEICDEQSPRQCRVSIQWQLEDGRGVVVYRATTRAVDQAPSLDAQRRSLVLLTLRSLLQRPRFAEQLLDTTPREAHSPSLLGFRRCARGALLLPGAERVVAAGLVSVQAGSSLLAGTIVSPDGLILTSSRGIRDGVPLQIHFRAGQQRSASLVALAAESGVALLHVRANTDSTCVPLREQPVAPGSTAFGVSSDPTEGDAISLGPGVVERVSRGERGADLQATPRIATAEGAPLLDEDGRLLGLVSRERTAAPPGAGIEAHAALAALGVEPAPATDPRLLAADEAAAPLGYVRDADDPPFLLTKRYTFGTSETAHTLRLASAVTAGVGAFGVGATWMSYRFAGRPSPAGHQRLVVANDIAWALVGLGAVGIGVSYALPEGHDQVAVRVESATRRELFVRLAASGLAFGARL